MGFFDSFISKLNPAANQSDDFKKSVAGYKARYVNLSKDELRAKLAQASSDAEKAGINELLYGVGLIGAVAPAINNLIEAAKSAAEKKAGKIPSEEDTAHDPSGEEQEELATNVESEEEAEEMAGSVDSSEEDIPEEDVCKEEYDSDEEEEDDD